MSSLKAKQQVARSTERKSQAPKPAKPNLTARAKNGTLVEKPKLKGASKPAVGQNNSTATGAVPQTTKHTNSPSKLETAK